MLSFDDDDDCLVEPSLVLDSASRRPEPDISYLAHGTRK